MKLKIFPHISRKITARGLSFVIWVGLTALFSLNLWQTSWLSAQIFPLVTHLPNSLEDHLQLAQNYHERGFSVAAKRELLLAQELWHAPATREANSVLGTANSPLDLLREWEQEPGRLKAEASFWQETLKEKADYRDAYVRLAEISYELNRAQETKTYLSQALSLDPNNSTLLAFWEKIQAQ